MMFRNIDKVKFLVNDATGLDIMYAYEDLVFPEHGAFIIRFDEKNENNFFCFFNNECPDNEQKKILDKLNVTCANNNCTINNSGKFSFTQKEQEVEINFI